MMSHPSVIISLKESDMKHWNMGGEFVMPKNMTMVRRVLCG